MNFSYLVAEIDNLLDFRPKKEGKIDEKNSNKLHTLTTTTELNRGCLSFNMDAFNMGTISSDSGTDGTESQNEVVEPLPKIKDLKLEKFRKDLEKEKKRLSVNKRRTRGKVMSHKLTTVISNDPRFSNKLNSTRVIPDISVTSLSGECKIANKLPTLNLRCGSRKNSSECSEHSQRIEHIKRTYSITKKRVFSSSRV